LKDEGVAYDAILADVETDPAAADAFAQKAAEDSALGSAARLALSNKSIASPHYVDCVPKLDRSALLAAIEYAVSQKEIAA
jgi:hypothetical protein